MQSSRGTSASLRVGRHWLLWFAVLALIPFAAGAATKAAEPPIEPIDQIAVVVNDSVITESEIAAQLANTDREIALRGIKAPPAAILRRQVVDRMVLEQIELQAAKRASIPVTDDEVNQAITRIAERNHMDLSAFFKTLKQKGFDVEGYRKNIRDQIIIQKLIQRDINDRVTVSEAEIDNFLAQQAAHPGANNLYNISLIAIPIPEAASPQAVEAAKQRAEDIHKRLVAGANFAELAVSYSQGVNAMNGGELGWKPAGQLPEAFVNVLRTMSPGQVSDVLRSPNGFYLLKLNGVQDRQHMPLVTQTHVRHILIRPSEVLTPAEARQKLEQIRQRILDGADFATLAKGYSEDPGSAAEGGDLGWVNPGQMVPQFERAMDALKVGEISQPVQTPYGFDLIQVLGRRKRDISREVERDEARAQLRTRKADEHYEQWVRQLREDAYVKYLDQTD